MPFIRKGILKNTGRTGETSPSRAIQAKQSQLLQTNQTDRSIDFANVKQTYNSMQTT